MEISRTYAILKDPAYLGNVLLGYHIPQDDSGNMKHLDYRALSLVRLAVDRHRDRVRLFVEDMDNPVLDIPLYSSQFPNASSAEGSIDVGHFNPGQSSAVLNVASVSYSNRYMAWESDDALPGSAPIPFDFREVGGGTSGMRDGMDDDGTTRPRLVVEKSSFGPSDGLFSYYFRSADFACSRGCQVDFRSRVFSYTDPTGVSNAANQWTGAGITVFFGTREAPLNVPLKLHVGFFDCGAYGRKIAIVPGTDGGVDEIINQTELGQLYSADTDWTKMTSYRLVYQPGDRVEIYNSNFIKDAPIISIPWSKFIPERDEGDTGAGVAFGLFNSDNNCTSEWKYVRWGISTGYEIELLQQVPNYNTVFDGRALAVIDVTEVTDEVSEIPGTTFISTILDLIKSVDSVKSTQTHVAVVNDLAHATDQATTAASYVAVVHDSVAFVDYADASGGEYASDVHDSTTYLDAVLTVAGFVHVVNDSARIVDSVVTESSKNAIVLDSIHSVDSVDASCDFVSSILDAAVVTDSVSSTTNDGDNDSTAYTGATFVDWADTVVESVNVVDDVAVADDSDTTSSVD